MAVTEVELVTPTRTLFSGSAEMVVTRTEGGEIAFLADHMPYLAVLEPALTRVVHEGGEDRFATHGGFVQVNDNRVVMLVDVAERAADIDVARAQRAHDSAEGRLSSDAGDEDAKAALRRATARLETAGRVSSEH